uniref:RNA-dependent RNA polymerase n=1 Tax=Panagrolaimus superbus TaxID=310955 RepID=A0A914XV57_9BILA
MICYDDKIFEVIVLQQEKAIRKACREHGKVKIRSALISKIVIDANDCTAENDFRRFIDYFPRFNDICKIHLQYPHDILFPAEVECASENVKTATFFSGFLYSYKFMHTTTLLENQNDSYILRDITRTSNYTSNYVNYPHTNWYHDQGILRLTLPKRSEQLKFEFDYSSFLKIYVHRPRKEQSGASGSDMNDITAFMRNMSLEHNTYQLTFTIAIGYSPCVFLCGKEIKYTRVYDLPQEVFWKTLIRSSAIQVKLSFGEEQKCRDFLSHLHSAVTCPIVFLPQPLEIQAPDLPLILPNVSFWPWEIQYGIQMIMDCGDIGSYHFQKQNYIGVVSKYVEQRKFDDALAFLAAIRANLKLQPMMEVIEAPRPITVNFGEDYVMMRTVIITPMRKICCPPMQLMSSRAFRILGGAEKFIQVKFRDENMRMMQRNKDMMQHVVLYPGLQGIVIAGRRFYDLARSNSMFREHGSYFYQTENPNEIVQILKSLGNFKLEPSSKTASRVAQYFTSAKEVIHRLGPHEYTVIPDYFSNFTNAIGERYCFSDGVGLISLRFANYIKDQFNLAYLPSAFQIRFLGFKGVLSIDDRHPLLIDAGGDKLVLFRESQKKFDVSKSMEVVLGIVKLSAPALVRFNKPLINLWDQAAKKQGLSTIFDKRVNELFTESLYHITSSLINNKNSMMPFESFQLI